MPRLKHRSVIPTHRQLFCNNGHATTANPQVRTNESNWLNKFYQEVVFNPTNTEHCDPGGVYRGFASRTQSQFEMYYRILTMIAPANLEALHLRDPGKKHITLIPEKDNIKLFEAHVFVEAWVERDKGEPKRTLKKITSTAFRVSGRDTLEVLLVATGQILQEKCLQKMQRFTLAQTTSFAKGCTWAKNSLMDGKD